MERSLGFWWRALSCTAATVISGGLWWAASYLVTADPTIRNKIIAWTITILAVLIAHYLFHFFNAALADLTKREG